MSPKIGIVLLGHRDYPNEIGLRIARGAESALKASGTQVLFSASSATNSVSSARQTRALIKRDVHGIIFFIGTWLEASTAMAAIREAEHLPIAIWGFPMLDLNGTRQSSGSLVAYQVIKAALDRVGCPYVGIVGLPDEAWPQTQALSFARAAFTAEYLKKARIGLIGYASMSMYCGTADHLLLRWKVGPEIEHVDTYTLIRRAESVSKSQTAKVLESFRESGGLVDNSPAAMTAARLYIALRGLVKDFRFDAVTVKCQYELSQDYGMTACVPLSLLADEGIVCSCEGDVLCTTSMLAMRLLANQIVTYADLLDVTDTEVLFSSCGFAPLSLAANPSEIFFRLFDHPGFNGLMASFTLKPGKLTFLRIAEGVGEYTFIYGLGEGLPSELRQGRFPALRVKLEGSAESLLKVSAGQHYAIAYGDLGPYIEMLALLLDAKVLRI